MSLCYLSDIPIYLVKDSSKLFVAASVPAALVGAWNLGANLQRLPPETTVSWQRNLLDFFGVDLSGPNGLAAFALGSAHIIPLLVTALAVSRAWAEIFSRSRNRPLDPGWLLTAWLFTLMLPATIPIHFAALGLSFGVVFASHAFGGTGRYIVNPALLGLVFLALAYPDLGAGEPTSWALLAVDGVEASEARGMNWGALSLGSELGALGTTSAAACLFGAGFLLVRGAVSWSLIIAALVAMGLTSALIGQVPWYWHLVLGNFAFALAFVATDPTTRPMTSAGTWAYGVLFGALTIVIRIANPEHPEGTWFALLLASLFVPLSDHIATSSHARNGRQAQRTSGAGTQS